MATKARHLLEVARPEELNFLQFLLPFSKLRAAPNKTLVHFKLAFLLYGDLRCHDPQRRAGHVCKYLRKLQNKEQELGPL